MNSKTKKILNISLKCVTWLLVAFTVFMMIFTVVTVTTVDRNDRSIFGIRFYIVQTDSMSKSDKNADMDVHFNAGDIIMIKNVKDPTALQPGDIIAFMSTNAESYGQTITHMIREVKKTENGRVQGYVTFGTNTGVDDEVLVEPSYVIGQYAGKLPKVGIFFAFVKSTPGYIVCILVPFMCLILYNGVNMVRLFRKYKKKQTNIMEQEKAKIEAERKQNEEILRELQALKEELSKKINTPQ
ncbi:MAG: signal peptidase I [Clostridia bacterium]|nr:signal peptidase I [Clostridia bacterium]